MTPRVPRECTDPAHPGRSAEALQGFLQQFLPRIDTITVEDLATKPAEQLHGVVRVWLRERFMTWALQEYLTHVGACEHRRDEEIVMEARAQLDLAEGDALAVEACRQGILDFPKVLGLDLVAPVSDVELTTSVARGAVAWLRQRGAFKHVAGFATDTTVSAQLRVKRLLLEMRREQRRASGKASKDRAGGKAEAPAAEVVEEARSGTEEGAAAAPQVVRLAEMFGPPAESSSSSSVPESSNTTRKGASATSSTECGGTDSDSANGKEPQQPQLVQLAELIPGPGSDLAQPGADSDGASHQGKFWWQSAGGWQWDYALPSRYNEYIVADEPERPDDFLVVRPGVDPAPVVRQRECKGRRRPHRSLRQFLREAQAS
mmetsp:Transcript_129136/g.294713  ORF Transcript_129136/g.294713 Transcript_129136/m.294713 type:complete len:375 (-) Transcript_129136:431-1555(-)